MRIMPSGNGSMDWVPKGLTKTASTNGAQEEVPRDDLFEAAKKVVANMGCCSDQEVQSQDLGGDDVLSPMDSVDGVVDGDTDAVEFGGEEVSEVSETGDEGAVECLEKAKEAIEEAVECLGGGDADAEENNEFEVEVEIEDNNFDAPSDDDDVVEGGKECCDKCNCAPCKCNGENSENCCADTETDLEATASGDGWVKLSAISPNNRKKIVNYWSKQLGYPKDFVKLMVKDYEK